MAENMMQALVCTRIEESDTLHLECQSVPRPKAGPGEILVKVKAASLNYPDLLMCQGLYQFKPEAPFIPGIDLAGEVAELGEGVTNWEIGDEIAGGSRFGGFAEYAVCPAIGPASKPSALSFSKAAAYPAAYLTAYVSLVRRAQLQPGEWILVHGATGGVGLATIDLARHLGAKIIATTGRTEKQAALKDYGVEHVISTDPGFKDVVKDITGGKGVNVVFDPVGGDVFDESLRAMAFDGRILIIGFTSGRKAVARTNYALIKGISIMGVRAGEYGRQFPEKGAENIKAIWDLAAKGHMNPHVCAEISLKDGKQAFEMMAARQVFGKVIIRP